METGRESKTSLSESFVKVQSYVGIVYITVSIFLL